MPKRPASDYNVSHTGPPRPLEHPAALAAAASPSPLTIILDTMRAKYAAGDLDGAVALARIAAPYLHARLPAAGPTHNPSSDDLIAMPDADLDALGSPD